MSKGADGLSTGIFTQLGQQQRDSDGKPQADPDDAEAFAKLMGDGELGDVSGEGGQAPEIPLPGPASLFARRSSESSADVGRRQQFLQMVGEMCSRVLASDPRFLSGSSEVRLTLTEAPLVGVELRVKQAGNSIDITFASDTPEALKLLDGQIAGLASIMSERLKKRVEIGLENIESAEEEQGGQYSFPRRPSRYPEI